MNLMEAAGEIMEALDWERRASARGATRSQTQRSAIRLALAFDDGAPCAELVRLVRGVGVLAMLGAFELVSARENPGEFGRQGPHGILAGIRTGIGQKVVSEGGDATAVGERLWRAEEMLAEGSARRLYALKLRLHLEACAAASCREAMRLLELGGGQIELLVLAWAWAWDAWHTVADSLGDPMEALGRYEDWQGEAAHLGAELAILAQPETVAVRGLAHSWRRAGHSWVA